MPDEETVKLNITIRINTEGEFDTGIPVDKWNAMSDAERQAVAQGAWEVEVSNGDSGGMSVTTDGAEGI